MASNQIRLQVLRTAVTGINFLQGTVSKTESGFVYLRCADVTQGISAKVVENQQHEE